MVKYRVGWYSTRTGKWKYITCSTKEDMIAEVADKTTLSDKVSVRVMRSFQFDDKNPQKTE